MSEETSRRRAMGKVVPLPAPRRGAPGRRPGGRRAATAGSLALAADAAPLPTQRPAPFPTPSRWFSERNGAIGFRLYDAVYVFARAARGLPPADALEWGARFFMGAHGAAHARNVLAVLQPGREFAGSERELIEPVWQAFREAVLQGAGRLLGSPGLSADQLTKPEADRLCALLESLYETQGWLLPPLPFGLHLLLRKLDLD